MPTARADARTQPAIARAALLAAALAASLLACAAPGPGGSRGPALDALAARETPDRAATFRGLPLPPNVPAERLELLTESELARAAAPLEDVLAALEQPEPPAPREPSAEALRLYIQGRAALVDGEPDRAISLLERAVDADPEAAAAWRDLGEARRRTGQRFTAGAAYREALAADPYERRALLRLGLEAAARRDAARAVDLLSRIDLRAHPGDPAEPYLVRDALGRALIETGRLRAGADLLALGAAVPDRFSRPTNLAEELEQLYRRRADAWTAVGDARARLDDPARALEAYQRAAEHPSFDPLGLLARRLYALLAQGRPAAAAAALTSAVGEEPVTIESAHTELVGYLASAAGAPRVMTALERDLAELQRSLPPAEAARLAGRFALARAAALPDRQAARLLRERLAEAPGDARAIDQLFARAAAGSPAGIAEQVAALIEESPLNERAYTRAAIRAAGDPRALLDAIDPDDPAPAAQLLRARLLLSLARFDDAEEVLLAIIERDRTFAPAVSALAQLLITQGRTAEASAVIDELDPAAGQPALLAKAAGLTAVGRAREALDLLRDAASAPDASARVALELGSLAERLQLYEEAAERYRQAKRADPQLEEAHASLIRLHAQSGPLADREVLLQAVRDLRDAVPSARTLRWLRAQELASTGQYAAAERALRDLAEESPDPPVVQALVSVWIATSSAADAEAWLRDQLDRRPDDTNLIAQLARSLSAQGKHAEAATRLRAELEQRPGDNALSAQLESILREHLDRAEEADELALARLQNAPPTVSAGLQKAGVYLRRDQPRRAAEELADAIRQAPGVQPQELQAALQLAQRLGADSRSDRDLRPLAIDVIGALVERGLALPEPAHRLRLLLMATAGTETAAIEDAVALAYEQTGEPANRAARAAAQSLVQQGRPRDAADVLRRAASAHPAALPDLGSLWLGVVAQHPYPDSAEALVTLLHDRGEAAQTAAAVMTGREEEDLTQDQAAAELAFAIAQQYGGQSNDDDAAARLYRVTLRYDPAHAMANNNLGYQILESGDNLDEAETLIQRAYDANPNSPAVIDSLGWVRYRRGIILDQTDADGNIVTEGAVTLLERAVEIARRENDPGLFELHTHLGDAYWRAGRQDKALEQWRAGRAAAQNLVDRLGAGIPRAVPDALENLQARLDAVEARELPPVAPSDAPGGPAAEEIR